ncbi:phosphatase domain-containing protein [Arthrobacter woluwensis]|uniref:phosphatase domain-containing protein n=1 Tax=Arthrobacter woluwensis TaxID=156980 RepID=UPI003827D198
MSDHVLHSIVLFWLAVFTGLDVWSVFAIATHWCTRHPLRHPHHPPPCDTHPPGLRRRGEGLRDLPRTRRELRAHPEVLRAAIKVHADGVAVLILAARRAKHRASTRWWLIENGIHSPAFRPHRPDRDGRRDVEVKGDILDMLRDRYDIIEAWDGNRSIIELWRSEGIPVRIVPGWESDE